jgi:hypothetical protein
MRYELRTMGHATLCLLEDGIPLIATDPWLVGSVYWRSWWLEKYPTNEELELVKRAKHVYITHSHPDHFHWPTLRRIGPTSTLHPFFPGYTVPKFLEENGFRARTLRPWQWYPLSESVRIMSIPVPVDDSLLVIETPNTTVLNLNDSQVPLLQVHRIRSTVLTPGKPVVVLKSYSPASAGVATYRDGARVPHRTTDEYAKAARLLAERFGARVFVPFASQAFFNRHDSSWANEFKVTYERLLENWKDSPVKLAPPFVRMDLDVLKFTSSYDLIDRQLDKANLAKVAEREAEEADFELPVDFDARLKTYMTELRFIRLLFPRGVGWRLSTSGGERFFNSKTGDLEPRIPKEHDFVVTLPDKVLYEALCNNMLTDLGITMLIRVDTNVATKRTYAAFLLMGLHDYGHVRDLTALARVVRFYAPTLFGLKPGMATPSAAQSWEVLESPPKRSPPLTA